MILALFSALTVEMHTKNRGISILICKFLCTSDCQGIYNFPKIIPASICENQPQLLGLNYTVATAKLHPAELRRFFELVSRRSLVVDDVQNLSFFRWLTAEVMRKFWNQGEPRTDLTFKIGEAGGTRSRPGFKKWGTKGNREPTLINLVPTPALMTHYMQFKRESNGLQF